MHAYPFFPHIYFISTCVHLYFKIIVCQHNEHLAILQCISTVYSTYGTRKAGITVQSALNYSLSSATVSFSAFTHWPCGVSRVGPQRPCRFGGSRGLTAVFPILISRRLLTSFPAGLATGHFCLLFHSSGSGSLFLFFSFTPSLWMFVSLCLLLWPDGELPEVTKCLLYAKTK